MIYLELFWSFFQAGLFSIGGGYAIMPMLQSQMVGLHHWLTMNEFIDIITISQMTPGPIAINAATFIGMRVGGIWGAIIATIGCVTPSCIIVLTLAYFYFKYKNMWIIQGVLKGLRPAVVSLIASAALSIILMALFNGKSESWFSVSFSQLDLMMCGLFLSGVLILRKFKTDPIYIMVGSGVIGLIFYLV